MLYGFTVSKLTILLQNRRDCLKHQARDTFRNAIGWCLERVGAPARLNAFEFVDPVSDETIYLSTSKRYSVLCVGDRRFYFDRISGKFDGISAPASSIPGGIEFLD
jgi:hypothetical protein